MAAIGWWSEMELLARAISKSAAYLEQSVPLVRQENASRKSSAFHILCVVLRTVYGWSGCCLRRSIECISYVCSVNTFSIVLFSVRKIVDKTFPKSQTDCRLAVCPCIAAHNLFTILFSVVHCSFEYKMKMSFHVVIWLTPPAVEMPCNELV